MGVLKIKEAIEMAKSKGVKITQMKIARKIWPDSTPAAQRVNMYNLVNGETARVSPDWIKIISEECGVTADFLLGINKDE
ncbi:hypothetical protein PD691P3_00030 [Parabacteroides phage PD691P3]|jgi:hypothetical protein|nr:hypothetical protein PD482P1_00047 [Parabacteroides phage PD482P1]WAX16915.1 hypothetical protein PD691P3_00030 [Parabacteroides phage PD691P3]WAX17032.1 hypothetical protein PD691P6_00027 [Parabacteroides phage PD691P6]